MVKNSLLEEKEFYQVALDPNLDQIDIGMDDILDDIILSQDNEHFDSEKRHIPKSPWRNHFYDPYHSPPNNRDV